jgi:hypothetical protein
MSNWPPPNASGSKSTPSNGGWYLPPSAPAPLQSDRGAPTPLQSRPWSPEEAAPDRTIVELPPIEPPEAKVPRHDRTAVIVLLSAVAALIAVVVGIGLTARARATSSSEQSESRKPSVAAEVDRSTTVKARPTSTRPISTSTTKTRPTSTRPTDTVPNDEVVQSPDTTLAEIPDPTIADRTALQPPVPLVRGAAIPYRARLGSFAFSC